MGILSTLSVIAVGVYLALAIFTLSQGLGSRPNRYLFVLTGSMAFYSLAQVLTFEAPDAAWAWRWQVVGTLLWAAILPVQLFLVFALTGGPRRHPWWLHALLVLPMLFVSIAGMTFGDPGPKDMVLTSEGWARSLVRLPASSYFAAIVLAYLVAALVLQIRWGLRVKSRRQRRQAAWLAGSGVLSVGMATLFLWAFPLTVTPEVPRPAQVFAAVWAVGYTVAIFRHRLMAPSPALAAGAILGAIQDLVVLADDRGRILTANDRVRTLLGYAVPDMAGRPVESIARDPSAVRALVDQVPETPQAPQWSPAVLVSREGIEVPIQMSVSAILDQDGDRVGFAMVAQDERPMREALKAERIESIGVLAGGIAHDFNNLLTAISGYVGLAGLDVPDGTETKRRLEEAAKACRRAQGLTQQLLTFSRGGAPVRKATSLEDLLRDSASFVTSGSSVRVEISVPSNLWLVDVDEGQIAQVVHNLCLNAVQAMPTGGTLHLSARNLPAESQGVGGAVGTGERVRLTVRDEGHGIAPENLGRVFEPFFTTKPSGTGLGLATVYSIVRRHGGEIGIESRPGEGTTFQVDLPRARRISGMSPVLQGGATKGRGRILVMDDQANVRQVAEEMLASLGYEAVGCRDGIEAIELHHAALDEGRPFDVVLLDLTVPGGMGGVETLRAMRSRDPGLRAIVSSGYAADAEMADFRGSGFDRALPKPYTLEGLQRAIEGSRSKVGPRGNLSTPGGEITP